MDRRVSTAVRAILSEFAERTGLTGAGAPRRYLWTDAFAVCTFLAVHRETGAPEALESAARLVDQVHATLGRHRPDDARAGWISGLSEEEGRAHPTLRGLRIGKRLGERGPEEPFDERLEWDRDGQYFHYLTKWMHALARVAGATGDERYLRWAVELARAAHAGFTYGPASTSERPGSARKRMVWKASIDLTRPLVPPVGAHDPLDGLITFRSLLADARKVGWSAGDVALDGAIEDMRAMCAGVDWATPDPLGTGGLLCDAYRLAQLPASDPGPDAGDASLLEALVDGAARGLGGLVRSGALQGPAGQRLAFRELGLAIGLHAVPRLARLLAGRGPGRRLAAFDPWLSVATEVETFWLEPASQRAHTWREHLDINSVMLATSLMPGGFLEL